MIKWQKVKFYLEFAGVAEKDGDVTLVWCLHVKTNLIKLKVK